MYFDTVERATIWETMAVSLKGGKGIEVQLLEQLIEMNRRLERLEQAMAEMILQPEGRRSAPRSAA
jgi:uncharacterized protein YbaP (TraB family)